MKKLEKLNKELFFKLESNKVGLLNQIMGGETKTTMGTNTTVGADGKLKHCDFKDKQDYVVTKDGVRDIGAPYGFEVIECCYGILNESISSFSDQFSNVRNDSN